MLKSFVRMSQPTNWRDVAHRLSSIHHPLLTSLCEPKKGDEVDIEAVVTRLQSLSVQEQRVVLEGIDEEKEEKEDNGLHSVVLMREVYCTKYTYVDNNGPCLLVRLYLDRGDEQPRVQVDLRLNLEVVLAHFSLNHPNIRARRMKEQEHNQAIDYLPLQPGGWRVFEMKSVQCSFHVNGDEENEYGVSSTTSSKRPRSASSSPRPGLVVVRDSWSCVQACHRCLMTVCEEGRPVSVVIPEHQRHRLHALRHANASFTKPARGMRTTE